MAMTADGTSVIGPALAGRTLSAEVVDIDTYRPAYTVGLETDYIVKISGENNFESFKISKTFSEFRSLASNLRRAAKLIDDSDSSSKLSAEVRSVRKIAQTVSLLIDKEGKEYVGKVSYMFVKSMAKQRRSIIDLVLAEIVEHYPTRDDNDPAVKAFTTAVQSFLLTDYVVEDDDEAVTGTTKKGSKRVAEKVTSPNSSPDKKEVHATIAGGSGKAVPPLLSPSVKPMSRKSRRSLVIRKQDEQMLQSDAFDLVLDEDSTAKKPNFQSTPSTGILEGPFGFIILAMLSVYVLYKSADSSFTVDSDIAIIIGFACYCLGVHSPRSSTAASATSSNITNVGGISSPRRTVRFSGERPAAVAGRGGVSAPAGALLRKSMRSIKPIMPESVASSLEALVEEEDKFGEEHVLVEEEEIVSPMPIFPEGAPLGSVMNCWSEPTYKDFRVRGKNYLTDGVKVPSGPFLFPVRGVDLFLTDTCPENVGRNKRIMGGKLRDVPTMIINFRLPWGVLLYYFEIPKKFVPFLSSQYDPSFDKSNLPSLDGFSGAERSAARYLAGTDEHKNETLKIVPVVVNGPWVVKSVVGGKPAIIGTKMPVGYVYQPAEPELGKAEYLEVDLDIVASSAARGILSVVRGYTNILTMDLGFVIQGNEKDELPEQMLVGARLHSIDPLTAPSLPAMPDIFNIGAIESTDTSEE